MKSLSTLFFAFWSFLLVTGAYGAEETIQEGPSAFVPVHSYNFAQVVDGTEITHDFIIQNKGTAPLKIERVKTD